MKKISINHTLNQPEAIAFIKETLQTNPLLTRSELARFLCEKFNFLNARGDIQKESCLTSLSGLARRELIVLPECQTTHSGKWNPNRLGQPIPVSPDIPESVEQINTIDLLVVDSANKPLMQIYNELMCSEHPLGNKRIVGRQLRYLIKSEYGWLGAMAFSSSALYIEARDRWIGWQNDEIPENRDYVVNMSRFLIRNEIRCKNLATHVIGKSIKQLPLDYERLFGFKPMLIETFVDTEHYRGTCYKASNWLYVGQTKGRGRNDTSNENNKSIKDIYVYPLVKSFREQMGVAVSRPPEIKALKATEGQDLENWALQEFGESVLGDERLTDRLIKIASNKGKAPGESYLKAAGGNKYDIKAYYNFLNNERDTISFESILAPHATKTIQRMKGQKKVLVIQDTTDLNYSSIKTCEGLGFIGTNQTGVVSQGLKLHSSFVVNDSGIPLGILKAKCYAQKLEKVKKTKNERRRTPVCEKESYRWIEHYKESVKIAELLPETELINVMDREGDMYELLEEVMRTDNRVPVLMRAKHNRKVVDSDLKLFDFMREQRVNFELSVKIPPRREQYYRDKQTVSYYPERIARLEIRYKKVKLKPPESPIIKNRPVIPLWAIYLTEPNPPEGVDAINWFLITTMKVTDDETAINCIEWYRKRWRIEEFHRVLKTGCGIEKYQNKSAEVLKRLIAIDLVIAVRAMLLTLCGREIPGVSASELFDLTECQIISELSKKKVRTLGTHYR